jgi:hypothetical protein
MPAKIVAMSEIYSAEKTARAIEDATQGFSIFLIFHR